jgi:hypothetical protein
MLLTIIVIHSTGNQARALQVPSQLVYIYIYISFHRQVDIDLFYFFYMSIQEGEGGFELVTSAL